MRQKKPAPARLIEIGGGSGWQAQEFASAHYDVVSYDLASTEYAAERMLSGPRLRLPLLPEADGSADIIFSSNVLEHIPHVVAFQAELLRVLKHDGMALHILPSAAWRLWTSATHYPWVAQKLGKKIATRVTAGRREPANATNEGAAPVARQAGRPPGGRPVCLPTTCSPRDMGNSATP